MYAYKVKKLFYINPLLFNFWLNFDYNWRSFGNNWLSIHDFKCISVALRGYYGVDDKKTSLIFFEFKGVYLLKNK